MVSISTVVLLFLSVLTGINKGLLEKKKLCASRIKTGSVYPLLKILLAFIYTTKKGKQPVKTQ